MVTCVKIRHEDGEREREREREREVKQVWRKITQSVNYYVTRRQGKEQGDTEDTTEVGIGVTCLLRKINKITRETCLHKYKNTYRLIS